MALLRAKGISEKELSRRAGITHQSVASLFRAPANRPAPKTRIRLSTGRAIAGVLDVVIDEETGQFTVPVEYLDTDGRKVAQVPAAVSVIDHDAERVEQLLRPSWHGNGMRYAMNLDLWQGEQTLPLSLRVEWSALWVRLAELAAAHADPEAQVLFANTITNLGESLGATGGIFERLQLAKNQRRLPALGGLPAPPRD